jgi:hypothetical protein
MRYLLAAAMVLAGLLTTIGSIELFARNYVASALCYTASLVILVDINFMLTAQKSVELNTKMPCPECGGYVTTQFRRCILCGWEAKKQGGEKK